MTIGHVPSTILTRSHRGRLRGRAWALLALMAMYEVTRHYPYLCDPATDVYDGAAALAGTGVTYAALRRAVATAELGIDPRPLRSLIPEHPGDTAGLLRRLLADGDTRAGRLLAAVRPAAQ